MTAARSGPVLGVATGVTANQRCRARGLAFAFANVRFVTDSPVVAKRLDGVDAAGTPGGRGGGNDRGE
jgi:hypothetical protein